MKEKARLDGSWTIDMTHVFVCLCIAYPGLSVVKRSQQERHSSKAQFKLNNDVKQSETINLFLK